MTTATRTRAGRAAGPAAPPALWLTIRERTYAVRRVACDPAVADRAFRLLSEQGRLYDVLQTPWGPSCDCPDFVFRRDGLDPEGCKHVRALVGLGLLGG